MLHGPELEIERYVNLHLTRSQKGDIANYREGDVAVFHHDVYGVRAKAGDACLVAKVGDERVVLTMPGGKERTIDPSGYIRYRLDLFETRPMVLKAGDRVRWTRNDPARGLINGEHAEILSIRRVNVTIRTRDGREIVMARDDPQLHHLDHAYSSTVHAAQGITCDRAIAVLDTERGGVADQATFYVELTRARDNVVLLTDDREALIEALETSPAEQMSALRAIGEQFGVSTHTSVSVSPETGRPMPPAEKATVLDEAERENRKAAERFLDRALSAAAASIRQREEHATIAASKRAHVTEDPGYGEWRDERPARPRRLPPHPRRPRDLRQALFAPSGRGGRDQAPFGEDRIHPGVGQGRDRTSSAGARSQQGEGARHRHGPRTVTRSAGPPFDRPWPELPARRPAPAIGGGPPLDHCGSELWAPVRAWNRSTVAAATCSPKRSVSISRSSSPRPSRIMVRIVSSTRKERELRMRVSQRLVRLGLRRALRNGGHTVQKGALLRLVQHEARRRFRFRLRVHGEPALDHVARDGESFPLGQHPHASPVGIGA